MTPFPREQLRGWLASIAGLAVTNVVFRDEPDPIVGPDNDGNVTGILRIAITSSTNAFWETDYDDAPDTDGADTPAGTPNMEATTVALDYINLTLVYESYAPVTQTLAYDTLAKIRVRGWQVPALDALRVFFVGLVSIDNINNVPNVSVNTRALSVATMGMQISHTQIDQYLGDFIESAEGAGAGDLTDMSFDTDDI